MKRITTLLFLTILSFSVFSQGIGIYPQVTALGTDTYTASYSGVTPAPTSYVNGMRVHVKFTSANTGASTINLAGLGAKTIVKSGSSALVSGDIAAGQILLMAYDGTNFQILGGSGGGGASGDYWPLADGADITSDVYAVTFPGNTGSSAIYIGSNPNTSNGSGRMSIGYDYGGEGILGDVSDLFIGNYKSAISFLTSGVSIYGSSVFSNEAGKAGFNIGIINSGTAGNPSTGYVNGQGWLNGSTNKIMWRINGANQAMATETYTDAKITQVITNGVTTTAPSEDAVFDALVLKANLASPTFTGTPTLPTGTIATTQTAGNSTTAVATTAFVTTADNLKANLASPTFTGTPTLPTGTIAVTQTNGDNSTKVATTAYIDSKTVAGLALSSNITTGSLNTALGQISNLTFQEGSVTYTNQPNTEQYLSGIDTHRIVYDATNYTQVRVTAYVRITSASANSPRIYLQYTTDTPSTPAPTWVTIGAGTVVSGEAISLASSANRTTSWITLPAGAKANVLFRVATNGGDGVEDPQAASVVVQFKN